LQFGLYSQLCFIKSELRDNDPFLAIIKVIVGDKSQNCEIKRTIFIFDSVVETSLHSFVHTILQTNQQQLAFFSLALCKRLAKLFPFVNIISFGLIPLSETKA